MGITLMKKFYLFLLLIIFTSSISFAQIKIGVALPLMENSPNKEEGKTGEYILMGIKDALKEYNGSKPKKEVKLIIQDTQRDAALTLNIMNQFGNDKNVIAIFGPIFSHELAPNVGVGTFHKIPVISPTSTQNNLAKDNDYVFQLNPTFEIRGKLMAKYAMEELGMKNFVILSEESYGKTFADSFFGEVEKRGGRVINMKFYQREEVSISEYLSELKNDILKYERFIDFGNLNDAQKKKLEFYSEYNYSTFYDLYYKKSIVSIYKLFGKTADHVVDSLGVNTIKYSEDLLNYIPGYIDAIYIPIAGYPEIPKIISQYYSEKINLSILGTSDWNNAAVLHENKIYIDELYFDSDFYIKSSEKEKMKKINMNEIEQKNYYFGYDGIKLILDQINNGNDTRTSLSLAIEKINNYPAIHNAVTIKDRTNHGLSIMKFTKEGSVKISDYVY
jgi:hypothetical protein